MDSVLEQMYDLIYENLWEYMHKEEYEEYTKETLELIRELNQCIQIEQRGVLDKLQSSLMDCDFIFGLDRFKKAFKMGFKIACECLSDKTEQL